MLSIFFIIHLDIFLIKSINLSVKFFEQHKLAKFTFLFVFRVDFGLFGCCICLNFIYKVEDVVPHTFRLKIELFCPTCCRYGMCGQ